MRRVLFVGLAVMMVLGLAGPAQAQAPATFERVLIELWPDYDRQAVLVIYRGQVAESTTLPAEVSLRLPASAEVNAVAQSGPTGGLFDAPHNTSVEGEWQVVTFMANSQVIQLEYYDDYTRNGEQRNYVYTWAGDAAVAEFAIRIQEPFDATDMEIVPSAGEAEPGGDGRRYYTANYGMVEVGKTIEVAVQYEKPSNTLSVTQLVPADGGESGAPASSPTPSSGLPSWAPWVLGLAGLGLIGFGVYSMQDKSPSTRRGPRRRGRAKAGSSTGKSGKNVFCHNCGTQAKAGDKFCRECGQKLRV